MDQSNVKFPKVFGLGEILTQEPDNHLISRFYSSWDFKILNPKFAQQASYIGNFSRMQICVQCCLTTRRHQNFEKDFADHSNLRRSNRKWLTKKIFQAQKLLIEDKPWWIGWAAEISIMEIISFWWTILTMIGIEIVFGSCWRWKNDSNLEQSRCASQMDPLIAISRNFCIGLM